MFRTSFLSESVWRLFFRRVLRRHTAGTHHIFAADAELIPLLIDAGGDEVGHLPRIFDRTDLLFRGVHVLAEQNDRSAAEEPLPQRQLHFLVGDAVDVQLVLGDGQESHPCDQAGVCQVISGKGQGQSKQRSLFIRPEILQSVFGFSASHICPSFQIFCSRLHEETPQSSLRLASSQKSIFMIASPERGGGPPLGGGEVLS